MKAKLINEVKKGLETIYDQAESNGRKYAYQRILDLIKEGTIEELEDVEVACIVGINMANNEGIDTTGQ